MNNIYSVGPQFAANVADLFKNGSQAVGDLAGRGIYFIRNLSRQNRTTANLVILATNAACFYVLNRLANDLNSGPAAQQADAKADTREYKTLLYDFAVTGTQVIFNIGLSKLTGFSLNRYWFAGITVVTIALRVLLRNQHVAGQQPVSTTTPIPTPTPDANSQDGQKALDLNQLEQQALSYAAAATKAKTTEDEAKKAQTDADIKKTTASLLADAKKAEIEQLAKGNAAKDVLENAYKDLAPLTKAAEDATKAAEDTAKALQEATTARANAETAQQTAEDNLKAKQGEAKEPTVATPTPATPKSEPAKTTPTPATPKAEPAKTTPKPATPKAEPAKTTPTPETPKAEPTKAAPKPEAPKAEPAKTTPKPEAPKTEPAKTAPKPETPKAEPSKTTPKAEPSKTTPKSEAPKAAPTKNAASAAAANAAMKRAEETAKKESAKTAPKPEAPKAVPSNTASAAAADAALTKAIADTNAALDGDEAATSKAPAPVATPKVETEEEVKTVVVETKEENKTEVVETEDETKTAVVETKEENKTEVVETEEETKTAVVETKEEDKTEVVETEEETVEAEKPAETKLAEVVELTTKRNNFIAKAHVKDIPHALEILNKQLVHANKPTTNNYAIPTGAANPTKMIIDAIEPATFDKAVTPIQKIEFAINYVKSLNG